MQNLVGTTLKNQYYLRERAGEGATSEVYLAWDRLRATKMAVKVLRRDAASEHDASDAFRRESKLLSELQHPNIVRLYEFGREGRVVYIVMAWIDGGTLRQRLVDLRRPFSAAETAAILGPICGALNFAHNSPKPVVHCDIKPSNIMLHNNGRDVFLADFGISRLASERKGGGGTPPYMAPERFTGVTSPQTDIYALGVTVYELLSGGRLPYSGTAGSSRSTTWARYRWEHAHLPLPPLSQFNRALPEAIIAVVEKALHKEPDRRFASALAFWEAFERVRAVSAAVPAFEPPTVLGDPGVLQQTAKRSPGAPQPPVAPPVSQQSFAVSGGPHLMCVAGEMAGQLIALPRSEIRIGRGSDSDLHIHEGSVSRRHATFIATKRSVYLRDDGSKLGTLLNGKPVPPNVPMPLHHGDLIQIGYSQIFEFRSR